MTALADLSEELRRKLTAGRNLVLWNGDSEKWQDEGNDVFLRKTDNHVWRVSHRYGFDSEGKVRDIDFETETEAMTFYINYLFKRATGR